MEDYTAEMIKDMAFSFCPQCGTVRTVRTSASIPLMSITRKL